MFEALSKPLLKEYLALVRPRTLTAAISPVILGVAYGSTHFPPQHSYGFAILCTFILVLIAVLAQSATNMLNEYADYKSGLDLGQKVGNSRSIVTGRLTASTIRKQSLMLFGITLVLGILLSILTSFWLLPVGLACIAIAYSYSGGPYPISETPFGELASGLAMGFTLVMVGAYLWSGTVTLGMMIPAIPSMVLVGLILQTNSTRDIVNDKKHGRRTLAILIGRDQSIYVMTGL